MPHLTVYALESDLTGREPGLIAGLTEAVVAVYGEWARADAVVMLIGLPSSRWGQASRPAPRVTFGIHEAVFSRPDAAEVLGRLAAGVTDAIVAAVGEELRPGVTIDFAGVPEGRTAVGGTLVTGR